MYLLHQAGGVVDNLVRGRGAHTFRFQLILVTYTHFTRSRGISISFSQGRLTGPSDKCYHLS
jgi:hypothetical protein